MKLQIARVPALVSVGMVLLCWCAAASAETSPLAITVQPAAMLHTGDAAIGPALTRRCNAITPNLLPSGSIAIGANASHCDPAKWEGGAASVKVFLQDVYSPTMYALRINMADSGFVVQGVVDQDRHASILLDGHVICRVRLGRSDKIGEYWTPIQSSLVTSIVVRESGWHVIALTVPSAAAWVVRTMELIPYPYPQSVRGIAYSPYRDCQFPGGEYRSSLPSEEQIREDISILSQTCNAIRTYGVTSVDSMIPRIAVEQGLRTFVGAWIDTSDEKNSQEIEALTRIATGCKIDGVIIGNEYLLRCEVEAGQNARRDSVMNQKASYLAKLIRKARAGIHRDSVTFAVAETYGQVYDADRDAIRGYFQQVLDAVDMVLVHVYPFWENSVISGAARRAIFDYERVRELLRAQHKGSMIGETGWPSSGRRRWGKALPDAAASLTSQRRYLVEFLTMADERDADFMYFGAFDELWKTQEGTVGQHWGYCFSDRSNKHSFNGVLLPAVECVVHHGRAIVEPELPARNQDSRRFVIYNEWPRITQRDERSESHWESGPSSTPMKPGNVTPQMGNLFVPSGFMGNYASISLNECCRTSPQSGKMATRIDISISGVPSWAGVQWLANGEWNGPGINLYRVLGESEKSGIMLGFWAKGLRGHEMVKFGYGGNFGSLHKYEDDWTALDTVWTPYSFSFSRQDDLSDVIGGLFMVTDLLHNRGRPVTVFVDSIYFETTE